MEMISKNQGCEWDDDRLNVIGEAEEVMERVLAKVRDYYSSDVAKIVESTGAMNGSTELVPIVDDSEEASFLYCYIDLFSKTRKSLNRDVSRDICNHDMLVFFYYDVLRDCIITDVKESIRHMIAEEMDELRDLGKRYNQLILERDTEYMDHISQLD